MNYTSIEQSKKLLELGLDYKTADMWYGVFHGYIGGSDWDDDSAVETSEVAKYPSQIENASKREGVPCWSVGALLDLMPFPVLYTQMMGGGIFWGCKVQFPYDEQEPHIIDGQISQIDACYNMIVWLLENGYIK